MMVVVSRILASSFNRRCRGLFAKPLGDLVCFHDQIIPRARGARTHPRGRLLLISEERSHLARDEFRPLRVNVAENDGRARAQRRHAECA
jgi:hypothetical protein